MGRLYNIFYFFKHYNSINEYSTNLIILFKKCNLWDPLSGPLPFQMDGKWISPK